MKTYSGFLFSVLLAVVACGDSPDTTEPDTTPPRVLSVVPAAGDTTAGLTSVVRADFSESINSRSVDSNSFFLRLGSERVAGNVAALGSVITFTPRDSLLYSTAYEARVTTGVRDLAGNALLSDYVWSFRTVSDPTRWSVDGDRWIPELAVGNVGQVYALGSYYSGANKLDILVAKFGENGRRAWVSDFVTPLCDIPRGVASAGEYVYVLREQDQICMGGEVFLDKYDTAGTRVASVSVQSDLSASGVYTYDQRIFVVTAQEPYTGVIIEFNPELALVRRIESPGRDVLGVFLNNDRIYVAGRVLRSGHDEDAYVRKYDLNFNEVWTREYGDSTVQNGGFIAVAGSYVYAGYMTGFHATLGIGTIKPLVLVYDTTGNLVVSRILDSAGARMNSIAADLSGAYALVYYGDYGSGVKPFKINPQGNILWVGSGVGDDQSFLGDIGIFGNSVFVAFNSNKLAVYNAQSGQRIF